MAKTSYLAKRLAKKIILKAKRKVKPVSKKSAKEESPIVRQNDSYMSFLQNRIKGIEHELRISEKARQNEIKAIKQMLNELCAEFDSLREEIAGIKTEKEKRVEELEQKIKARAAGIMDFQKILEMERQLKQMQERYEQLKQQKKYPKASLEMTKKAIDSLKQKIEEKKKYIKPVEPGAKIETPQELAPEGKRPFVRHTIKFEAPSPKKPVPAEEIKPELPKMPSLHELEAGFPKALEQRIPKVPPELLKKPKKTFWQKMRIVVLGKPKYKP